MRRHAMASSAGSNLVSRPRRVRNRTPWALIGVVILALSVFLGVAPALADSPPTVTIQAPSEVAYTSADFSGTVNPNGGPSPANWHFELSETGEPGTFFQFDGGGEISGSQAEESNPVGVQSTPEFLQPGREYFVRLVASNEGGANHVTSEVKTFTTKAVAPPTVSIETPTEVTGTTAHLEGTINPGAPAGNPTVFDVVWRFECTPSCPFNNGAIPADSSDHTVAVDLTGLEPHTHYQVKLVASNGGGQASAGPVSMDTSQVAPVVRALYAGSLSPHSAILAGKVNPRNSSTTYRFEWGTDTSYGNVAPAAVQTIGASDDSFHVVTAPVTGLAEGHTYHYRLVATNTETSTTAVGIDHAFTTLSPSGPPAPCPNSQFRNGAASTLPDCRAYEQVSPIEKNGADVLGYETDVRAAANGDRVSFVSFGGFDGAKGLRAVEPYVGSREGQGWSTSALYPAQEGKGAEWFHLSPQTLGFSEQLDHAALELATPAPVPGAEAETENLYTLDTQSGAYTLLTSAGVDSAGKVGFSAGSADFSHVLFESPAKLTPEAPIDNPSGERNQPLNLYERANGQTRLVSILPDGEPAPDGGRAGAAYHEANGIAGGGISTFYTQDAISNDGSRIFWTDPDNYQVYVRIDGAETVQVSATQRAEPEAPSPALFLAATRSGSTAYFTSAEKLTNDSTAAPGGQGGALPGDLYAYDVESGQLRDLSVAESGTAAVVGVLGVGDDGESVYFAATGDPLAPGAPSRAELSDSQGANERANIYLWHDGEVTYIATVGSLYAEGGSDENNWVVNPVVNLKPSRVTPNGRYLLFRSTERITSYDSGGKPEFYRFDAVDHEVVCVTCNPRSSSPTTGAAMGAGAPNGQANLLALFQPNLMSADGQRVFFQTAEALVPADSNNRVDVYEWEDGQDYLISSGQAATESVFGDASTNGDNVFFVTRQQLVGQDTDQNIDMYDARVDGGLASQNTPAVGPSCGEETCHASGSVTPSAWPPASSTLGGPGNHRAKRHHKKKHHHQRAHQKKRRRSSHRRQPGGHPTHRND